MRTDQYKRYNESYPSIERYNQSIKNHCSSVYFKVKTIEDHLYYFILPEDEIHEQQALLHLSTVTIIYLDLLKKCK